jgi:hypothetical protein
MTRADAVDAANDYATAAINRDNVANAIAKEVVAGLPPSVDGPLVAAYRKADAAYRKERQRLVAVTVDE